MSLPEKFFPLPLCYRNLDGRAIALTAPFAFIRENGQRIEAPAGFVCDGQSYPRLLWCVDTPQGQGVFAGVIHDFLYRTQTRSRKEADQIFREALRASGVGRFRARIRYGALRLFGWNAWRKNKE